MAPRLVVPSQTSDAQQVAYAREADVLFHIKQTHAPSDCPYGKGGSRSLFDYQSKEVRIVGYWLAFPQHTVYLVVETDEIAKLQQFLTPGSGKTVCEITPVSAEPAPPPR